jgi:hypothetical protein
MAVTATVGCSKNREPSSFCSAAADVSALIEDQASAIDSQDPDGLLRSVKLTARALDRLQSSGGDLSDEIAELGRGYQEIQVGQDYLGTRPLQPRAIPREAATAGLAIDAKVQGECNRVFAFDPDPKLFLGGGPTTTESPTTQPTIATTTAPLSVQIATPEGVATALMELWVQNRLAETVPLTAENVVARLSEVDPSSGPRPVLESCTTTDATVAQCSMVWGGIPIEMTLTADQVGYDLGIGPAWVVVDLYFIAE